jgi:hypothetical protein
MTSLDIAMAYVKPVPHQASLPVRRGRRRLHRIALIGSGRSWASEIENLVDLHIKRKRDIMPDDLKMLVIEQMLDVASCTPGQSHPETPMDARKLVTA